MDVTETLDAMRSELPGCSLIAFTDLGSKLVLCSSSAGKPAQEELDSLSELAQTVLDGIVAEGAAPVLENGDGDRRAGTAMLLSGTDAKVFLRAPGDAAEALVCVCAPEADLRKVVDCGRSALDTIVSGT
ncbi:hypothetical protein [Silicimonas sp. MF1-12-2]|jgi:hypothetical protein|uniref:hypothetical protein n=1 Tax=Silicimonas sp. MF1-12-2 TaxID=3384793 RepID=UPI0039B6E27D